MCRSNTPNWLSRGVAARIKRKNRNKWLVIWIGTKTNLIMISQVCGMNKKLRKLINIIWLSGWSNMISLRLRKFSKLCFYHLKSKLGLLSKISNNSRKYFWFSTTWSRSSCQTRWLNRPTVKGSRIWSGNASLNKFVSQQIVQGSPRSKSK